VLPQNLGGEHVVYLVHQLDGLFDLHGVELDEELLVCVARSLMALGVSGPKGLEIDLHVVCCFYGA